MRKISRAKPSAPFHKTESEGFRGPYKEFLAGINKGSVVGFYDIRALIIGIGFGGLLYYNHNKEPQNSVGNYKMPPIL